MSQGVSKRGKAWHGLTWCIKTREMVWHHPFSPEASLSSGNSTTGVGGQPLLLHVLLGLPLEGCESRVRGTVASWVVVGGSIASQ